MRIVRGGHSTGHAAAFEPVQSPLCEGVGHAEVGGKLILVIGALVMKRGADALGSWGMW